MTEIPIIDSWSDLFRHIDKSLQSINPQSFILSNHILGLYGDDDTQHSLNLLTRSMRSFLNDPLETKLLLLMEDDKTGYEPLKSSTSNSDHGDTKELYTVGNLQHSTHWPYARLHSILDDICTQIFIHMSDHYEYNDLAGGSLYIRMSKYHLEQYSKSSNICRPHTDRGCISMLPYSTNHLDDSDLFIADNHTQSGYTPIPPHDGLLVFFGEGMEKYCPSVIPAKHKVIDVPSARVNQQFRESLVFFWEPKIL